MADYAIHDTTLIGISNVIRKKEGSSALIDPAEYAERINLMGMLEEKSASSASVCSFSDGADDVPMSSVVAHIAPTLTGTNAVNMVRCGKNFMPTTNYMSTYFSVASNGVVSQITASASFAWAYSGSLFKTTLPAGTYTAIEELITDVTNASHGVQVFNSSNTRLATISGGIKTAGTYSSTFTLTEETEVGMVCKLYDGTAKIYIVRGSSPTSYEAYTATTYTASLGRTVYGADVDLVSGQGTETNAKQTFTGDETWTWHSSGFWYTSKPESNIATIRYYTCSNGVDISYAPNGQVRCYASRNVGVVDDQTDMNALMDSTTAFIYDLDTGTDFTFDGQEIPSLLGVNNLWHDDGETEAVYRSSGTVTPVVPTLISKTITENGTYYAEDDNADGYDEVTVNVEGDEDMNYSTTEHEVGTWIDGSPIYERTFELQSQLTVSSSTWTSSGISADGIAKIMGVELFGVSNYQGGGLANIQNDVIMLQTTRNSDAYVKEFSLRYTKASVSLLSMSPAPTPSEPDSEDPEEEVEEEET